ncbi:MAG TPA: hypothetical protein VNO33_05720 [Kofleriaceae bacterium]|nr:hypothetical protein [Kofleriaceae bacterium]
MKSKLLVGLVLAAGLTVAATSPAFANKWINDFKWSQMLCIDIPGVVQRLESLADWAEDRSDQEEAAGNPGLAQLFDQVANEARGEANEGRAHYDSGDCVD